MITFEKLWVTMRKKNISQYSLIKDYLPPNFALIETANTPGQALALPGIPERLKGFAQNILNTLCLTMAKTPLS